MNSILIADDNPENLRVLSKLLKQEGYKIRAATDGKLALESFQAEPPDLILLDIQMPKLDGYEVCRLIKAQERYKSIPVIFISAMGESFNKSMAFDAGGDDYITKPLQAEEVLARIKTHLKVYHYQRQLEEKNIKLLQQFKTTFEQAAVGIAHIDINTRQYLKVNERFSAILGYSKDKLLKKTVKEITPPDFFEDDTLKVEQLINKQIKFFVKEKQYLKVDGSKVWCKITVSLVENERNNALNYLLTIIEDISDIKKIERKQKEYEQRIQQMQKMEAIGTLAGGIAHDFNNILSAIIGFTELALDEVDKGSSLEDSLHEICIGGKRARDLVKQILAFARQSEEAMKPIQLDSIAREVLKLLRASIPTTIRIEQNIKKDLTIMGNPTQIHQILLNICTNAAQAMEDDGGTLDVNIKDMMIDDSILEELNPGEYIEIRISDTGAGIAPEIIDKIYDPYFTTKDTGKGTGMGLALVYGIVKSYNGTITVESAPNQGTVFTVYLPLIQGRRESDVYQLEAIPVGNERILFVDDEPPIVKMTSQILQKLGYKVVFHTSSRKALQLFRSNPDDFDLVITDMTMPEMTGDNLSAELISIRRDIPVILCTGYSNKISDKTASDIGIKAFVYKPVSKADLAKTVRKVLDEAKGLTQGSISGT